VISFAIRRLAWALVTAFLASIVAFTLFWTIPNEDYSLEWRLGGGQHGNEATRARAVEKYGLDDPLPVQYARLMKQILSGEVDCYQGCDPLAGNELDQPGSVRAAFVEAIPVSLSLVAGAAVIAIALGLWLALVCVRHRGSWVDGLISAAATAAYAVPSLVLAALLWGFLTYKWQIFPDGYVSLTDDPLQWAWHLLLPWIAAALPFAGAYTKVVRASLLEAIELDHVRTARAKGLSERRVLRRHVLRNGLIPPANVWGLDFSHAFGGYVLYVEVIFGLPGVGLLTWATLIGLDLPPIVALAIYISIVVVLTSAIVDILVAYLDPRIRRADVRA
jgi:peptide/nickel transport system permease protein